MNMCFGLFCVCVGGCVCVYVGVVCEVCVDICVCAPACVHVPVCLCLGVGWVCLCACVYVCVCVALCVCDCACICVSVLVSQVCCVHACSFPLIHRDSCWGGGGAPCPSPFPSVPVSPVSITLLSPLLETFILALHWIFSGTGCLCLFTPTRGCYSQPHFFQGLCFLQSPCIF